MRFIGASLSEPHINGTAMREFYIIYYYYYYGTSVTRNYIPSDLYGHKRETFYCAFSCLGHRPYTRRSDLANCKFTLMLVLIKQATVPRRTEILAEEERTRQSSSSAQQHKDQLRIR